MVSIQKAMSTTAIVAEARSLDLKWTSHEEHASGNSTQVFETSGGPVATRTPDLYRVKVV